MPTIKKEIEEKKKKAAEKIRIAMDAATVDLKHGNVALAMKTLRWGLSQAEQIFPTLTQSELF